MKGNRTFQTQVNQPSKVQIMKTPSLKTNRGLSRLCLATCMTLSLITSASGVDIITRWTFEGDTTDPAIGSGTASLIGGTTASFAIGNGSGRGWNTTSYPAQGTGSGTAGVQFMVSTLNYENIVISFDHRASGTAVPLGPIGLHHRRRYHLGGRFLEQQRRPNSPRHVSLFHGRPLLCNRRQ